MQRRQYWSTPDNIGSVGSTLELRASLAWQLLEQIGIALGHKNGEDSAGRSTLNLLPADETVRRAFAIADAFVDAAEERGEIRHVTEEDVRRAHEFAGELEQLRAEARFPRE